MHCSTIYSLIHALERQRVQEDICICICGYSTCSKHILLPVECSVAVLAGQFNVLYMALAHARGPPRKYTELSCLQCQRAWLSRIARGGEREEQAIRRRAPPRHAIPIMAAQIALILHLIARYRGRVSDPGTTKQAKGSWVDLDGHYMGGIPPRVCSSRGSSGTWPLAEPLEGGPLENWNLQCTHLRWQPGTNRRQALSQTSTLARL